MLHSTTVVKVGVLGNGRLEGGRHYLESSHFWCAFAPELKSSRFWCAFAPELESLHFWCAVAPELLLHICTWAGAVHPTAKGWQSQIHNDIALAGGRGRAANAPYEWRVSNLTEVEKFLPGAHIHRKKLTQPYWWSLRWLQLEIFMLPCAIADPVPGFPWGPLVCFDCQDDQRQKTSICLRSIKLPDDDSFWMSGTLRNSALPYHHAITWGEKGVPYAD